MFAGPKQSAGTPPPTAPELVMCKSYSKNQFYALAYAIFYYFFIYSRYDRCDQRIVPPWGPPPYDPGVFNSGVRDRTSCKNLASKEVRYSVSPTGECVCQVDTKKYKQNIHSVYILLFCLYCFHHFLLTGIPKTSSRHRRGSFKVPYFLKAPYWPRWNF